MYFYDHQSAEYRLCNLLVPMLNGNQLGTSFLTITNFYQSTFFLPQYFVPGSLTRIASFKNIRPRIVNGFFYVPPSRPAFYPPKLMWRNKSKAEAGKRRREKISHEFFPFISKKHFRHPLWNTKHPISVRRFRWTLSSFPLFLFLPFRPIHPLTRHNPPRP